nr:MAG TPA: hypothetical protein [Caudoviricetes sp.]
MHWTKRSLVDLTPITLTRVIGFAAPQKIPIL